MKSRFILLLYTCCSITFCAAQDTIYFDKGFQVNGVQHYGREALYTDLLAFQMYSGKLQAPTTEELLYKDEKGQPLVWKPVTADSLHRFRGGGRMFANSGYLYVSYQSPGAHKAILNTQGSSGVYVNGAIHAGDPYALGWLHIPVELKKGLNEFYIRSGYFTLAYLAFPPKKVFLDAADPTLPVVNLSEDNTALKGAIVIINTSSKPVSGWKIKSHIAEGTVETALPDIPAMATRKIIFGFNAGNIHQKGKYDLQLTLISGKKTVDDITTPLECVEPGEHYSTTFVSDIDGSLQYYAVTPQSPVPKENAALFLSVHGAGVEAIGQARAYRSKDWGTLVAATNRRPRGFNWEDWGRLDAMEVLALAKQKFRPDPQHIYLTGHSMGGHGTWFLGAIYPDKWAAIAPSAGYPTLKEYGSHDGKIPDSTGSPVEQLLLRSGNQSDVVKLAENYKPLGVYIFHGDADRTVSVEYARQMKKVLAQFHTDFAYKEYPGGGHWISNESVDWPPIFDFFKRHVILPDSAVNHIDFKTSSPGISPAFRWAAIMQQERPLDFSRMILDRDNAAQTIKGRTENINMLKLALDQFGAGSTVKITLDSLNTIVYKTMTAEDSIYLLKQNMQWTLSEAPSLMQKNPLRYGTFKEAFNHHMIFVYGTKGTKPENEWAYNKARFDAESWYYRGNGAVDIIADRDFAVEKYAGRNVILYGNAQTNSAWKALLSDASIQVDRNKIAIGKDIFTGNDLAAYFIWPMKNSPVTFAGVVAGTGIEGMQAANANQYFAGGSGFPDFMIFRLDMLRDASKGIITAGFFDNNWKLDDKNRVGE